MKTFPTCATHFVKACVDSLRNRRRTIVIDAAHGAGKTVAAGWARKQASSKANNSQMVSLDGYHGTSEALFATHIAEQLGIDCDEMKPRETICHLRSQMCKRHVGLVILDDAQYLEPACQDQIIRLLDVSAYAPEHEIGLLVLQTGGNFADALTKASYSPALCELPELNFDEQLAFLVETFPVLRLQSREIFESRQMAQVLDWLASQSSGRPRTLVDILEGLRRGQKCGAEPTLKMIDKLLKVA